MNQLQQQLQQLYGDSSKHANYQNVPAFVQEALGYQETIDESWRGDRARYAWLTPALELSAHQTVADIGANTGFFVLSLAHRHPDCSFVAYESHPNHVDFIRLVVDAFELGNVAVEAQPVDLAAIDQLPHCDVLLHLNVLHHAGHDFDRGLVAGPQALAPYAQAYLSKLAGKGSRLVFQMGYNWGGDKAQPIVDPHDQAGMVRWLTDVLGRSGWQVQALAFATRDERGDIVYRNLPPALIAAAGQPQPDSAALSQAIAGYHLEQFKGEFYRRPLLICRSTAPRAAQTPESKGVSA